MNKVWLYRPTNWTRPTFYSDPSWWCRYCRRWHVRPDR